MSLVLELRGNNVLVTRGNENTFIPVGRMYKFIMHAKDLGYAISFA